MTFKGKSTLYSKQNISQPTSPTEALINLIFNFFKQSGSLYCAFDALMADSRFDWRLCLKIKLAGLSNSSYNDYIKDCIISP